MELWAFIEERRPHNKKKNKNNNKMISDMRSVPDLKYFTSVTWSTSVT